LGGYGAPGYAGRGQGQGYTPGQQGHVGHYGGPGQMSSQGQGPWAQQQGIYGGSPGYYSQGYGPQAYPGQQQVWGQGSRGYQHDGAAERRRRGPKGYERTDARLREEVCERIVQNPEIDASDVEIDVKNGVVTLKGTVESRQNKHRIEDVADSVWGVKDVENGIRVRGGEPSTPAVGDRRDEERRGGDAPRFERDR
jgi:osmotically-inducible protein OsmY